MTTPLDSGLRRILEEIAGTIRGLAIDGVQKADSGHPGLPLGCAELGAYLYGVALRQNPAHPDWIDRDRMILSAGHGSMWLYACLHLAGYALSVQDLAQFRQLHSKTPGHPERQETPGVETTTGPLGQGLGHAVGQALGLKLLAAQFPHVWHNKVYALMGDGCVMEGVSAEVSSLAGHLQLDNLVVFYDANQICLDGPIAETLSEDTAARYRAYGWEVHTIDGNDLEAIHQLFSTLKEQKRPALVIARTIIGKGSPNKAGTHKVHGSPLGPEEVAATKESLGLPQTAFYLPESVRAFFIHRQKEQAAVEAQWQEQFNTWYSTHPELAHRFDRMANKKLPEDLEARLRALPMAASVAGRKASQEVLNFLGGELPFLYGGSADLSCSDLTWVKAWPLVERDHFEGRNIKYGVREFGMATMACGLAETGMITPFIGTFLTFSDYMRNAIRLTALMRLQVVYQFTHDSIFLGEDGPTHQPIEHYAALRAIPRLLVFRPADSHEVKMAWLAALRNQGPSALLLSRQNLPTLSGTDRSLEEGVGRGAYILKKEPAKAAYVLFATGSEVWLALEVAEALEKKGLPTRVVSFPCWELFDRQPDSYRHQVLDAPGAKRVSIEVGVSQGWHRYIGMDGIAISVEDFGASAPYAQLQKAFGFTVDQVLEKIL